MPRPYETRIELGPSTTPGAMGCFHRRADLVLLGAGPGCLERCEEVGATSLCYPCLPKEALRIGRLPDWSPVPYYGPRDPMDWT